MDDQVENYLSQGIASKQKEQIDNMRAALFACDESNPFSVRASMQNILAMRIYHQVIRIIRYTEEMDKIENKLYTAVDATLSMMDFSTLSGDDLRKAYAQLEILLDLQERLQKSMIESQKLLDPYLNIKELTYIDIPQDNIEEITTETQILDQDSRNRLREGAQLVLETINLDGELVEDKD